MNERDSVTHSRRRAAGVMAAGTALVVSGVGLSIAEAVEINGHSLPEAVVIDIAETGLLLGGLGTILYGQRMLIRSRDEHTVE